MFTYLCTFKFGHFRGDRHPFSTTLTLRRKANTLSLGGSVTSMRPKIALCLWNHPSHSKLPQTINNDKRRMVATIEFWVFRNLSWVAMAYFFPTRAGKVTLKDCVHAVRNQAESCSGSFQLHKDPRALSVHEG